MFRLLKKAISPRNPLRIGWHRSKALVAALKYRFPARQLTIIGVTGTDGKTTTVGMTAHILMKSGVKVGALSTAFFQVNEAITFNATQKTSPSPFSIQRFLRKCVSAGCTHVVLECSSHGLDQGRLDWTRPKVAAITNLAEEHLDYHKTMEDYANTKAMLFRKLEGKGTKVLNKEDRTYAQYASIPSEKTITFSATKDADATLSAQNIHSSVRGVTATISQAKQTASIPLALSIPGAFNVQNALCAMSCAFAVGIAPTSGAASLSTFRGIPGRMERIDAGQPFTVFVDFTVTPQSYQRTLSTIQEGLEPGKRLLVLTGSCGDRMKEKRPVVGKICSDYADILVVANEDPYTEDPQKIIDDVWAGVDQSKTKAHKIFDRREAITFLLKEAKSGDVVLLCGKGSDTTMMMKDGQVPWNEREIVRELLQTL